MICSERAISGQNKNARKTAVFKAPRTFYPVGIDHVLQDRGHTRSAPTRALRAQKSPPGGCAAVNRRSPSGPPPHLPNGAKKTPRKSGCPPTGYFCHTGRGSAGPQKSAHGFPPALLIAGGRNARTRKDSLLHGKSPAKAGQDAREKRNESAKPHKSRLARISQGKHQRQLIQSSCQSGNNRNASAGIDWPDGYIRG